MKTILSTYLMSLFLGSCFAQLSVQSNLTQNKFSCILNTNSGGDDSRDLFFSIGPNGIPQYGKTVSWNFEPNTAGFARYFHVKKGDWDRSAIRTRREFVNFESSEGIYPPHETPNINMEQNWIKLGKSWNFSHDNYALAIISFTNQSDSILNQGTIQFSHPMFDYLNVLEIFNYNGGIQYPIQEISGRKVYVFEYNDLSPGEIRHLYVKLDISKTAPFKIPETILEVEMTGFQSTTLPIGGTVPPHDPNALSLLTALENTQLITDCDSYEEYPELEKACQKGILFWIRCPFGFVGKCPTDHSLFYPYCNKDSEFLTYRITCLNDGKGVARHIEMQSTFAPEVSPFREDVFEYSGSHNVSGDINYPNAQFRFEDINLPGLDNDYTVYTYDECSAQVTFELKTLCNLNIDIIAQASIAFFDSAENEVDAILTEELKIVPKQGVFTNYKPACFGCSLDVSNSRNGSRQKTLQFDWTNTELNISFERDSKEHQTIIKIIDPSGRVIKRKTIYPDGFIPFYEQIDISNLFTGIYFLSIQNGSKTIVEKFIHY